MPRRGKQRNSTYASAAQNGRTTGCAQPQGLLCGLLSRGLGPAPLAEWPDARGESRGAGAVQPAGNRDPARRSCHRSRPHPRRRHALSHPAAYAHHLAALRAQPRLAARLLLRSGACRAGRRRAARDCRPINSCGFVNQTGRSIRISAVLHRASRRALHARTGGSHARRRTSAHRRPSLRGSRRSLAARMVRRSGNPHDAAPGLRPGRARPTRGRTVSKRQLRRHPGDAAAG